MQQAKKEGKNIDMKQYEETLERLKPRAFWDT